MNRMMTVWTDGKGIRKFMGQDKAQYKVKQNEHFKHSEKNGWGKRVAIILTEEEYELNGGIINKLLGDS